MKEEEGPISLIFLVWGFWCLPQSHPRWREAELATLHVLAYIKHIRFGLGRIQSARGWAKESSVNARQGQPEASEDSSKAGMEGPFFHSLSTQSCVPSASAEYMPIHLCETLPYIDSQSIVETGLCLTFNIFCLMNNTKNTHKKSDDKTFQRHHQVATKQQTCFMSWSLSSFQFAD